MAHVLIFANPMSGRGKGKKIAGRIADRLAAEGYSVDLFLERADQISMDQLARAADAAIVIGGDGTLRTVAQRLLDGSIGEKKGSRPPSVSPAEEDKWDGSPSFSAGAGECPPLLIVPMGTANLMGKHLGIAWDDRHVDRQVLAALRGARVVKLDTATANGKLLLLVAGVGLDGKVVHELEKRRTGPISYLTYALPMLAAVGTYDFPALRVSVDGRNIFGPAPAMVFIGNVPEYGTGFPLLPLASPTDGLLDVCVLPCRSREELLAHVLRAAAGEHLQGEGVVYVKGRRIRVESSQPIPVQVDGEAAGHTPVAIDLLPVRLGFIVPN